MVMNILARGLHGQIPTTPHGAVGRATADWMLEQPDPDSIERDFEKLFPYKNKPVDCKILHYAVYQASRDGCEEGLRRVLECRADIHGKAKYEVEDAYVELEAVHIAAGLGCVGAMELLLARACGDNQDDAAAKRRYLETPTTITAAGAQTPTINFYYPIHDAVYQGQKDMVLWLLEQNVDATAANKDGTTPLHLLALVGGRPPLHESADVEAVTRGLLAGKASVEARIGGEVRPWPAPPTIRGKTPLQLAADTQYPGELLHLLAPSASMEGRPSRIFDDLLLLSTRNMKKTKELTERILSEKWGDDAYKLSFWKEAQRPVHVDHLANLLHTVPQAAAGVLDMLVGEPFVQAVRHPIPSRTALPSGSMRCTYQRDHMEVRIDETPQDGEDGEADVLRWPLWKCDGMLGKGEEWHETFLPKGERTAQDKVCDVETKVVLLANILDVDIFMALTQCGHNHVFTKLPVQGAIHCLWDNLVFDVFRSSLAFDVLELVALAWWGLNTVGGVGGAPPPWYPACWSLLFAGFLREWVNLLWWFMAHWSKWSTHTDPVMKSLWDPWALLIDNWFWPTTVLLLIRLAFLVLVWETRWGSVMSFNAQALLAGNAIAQGFRITYMLRLLDKFKSLLAISRAFFSGAIRKMLLITWMLFASFGLAFLVLNHTSPSGWTLTYLYRGLMFSDGDGLEKLGLGHTDSDGASETYAKDFGRSSESQTFSWICMAFGSYIFSIAILPLTQAIYTNEYDGQDTHLLFLKERAKYCLVYVEMMHKQRVVDTIGALCSGAGRGMRILRALALCARPYECMTNVLFEQRHASAVACVAWALVHDPVLLGPLGLLFPVLLGLLFGCLQVSWQARLVQVDWFQPDTPEEPSDNPGFLWICHPADYAEDQLSAKEWASHLHARLGKLEEKVDHLGTLEKKIDHLGEFIEQRLGAPADGPAPRQLRRGHATTFH